MKSLLHRIRNTRRAVEVAEVLARHGFAGFLARTGLDRVLDRGREIVGLPRKHPPLVDDVAGSRDRMSVAERLRHVMEELGPTFIKLGQVLSTRPDLVTSTFANEFRKLQSAAPQVPFEKIAGRLAEEFGPQWREKFREVEEKPMASASIAQAHRAVLADGTEVVLKITRPGVEQTVEADIGVLTDLATFLEANLHDVGFSPTDIVREFARQIRRELDFQIEGRSIDRLRSAFEEDERIHFTKVYWEATTRHVLAVEEVKGTLLSRLDPDTLTREQRLTIVQNGTDAVFRMCLDHGFFHADPHPGNIFVCEGEQLYFIDCGMTGYIEPRVRGRLATLVSAVIESDLDQVVRTAIELADGDPSHENDRAFRGDTWEIVTRFHTGTLDKLDVAALLNSFFDMLQRHRMQLPADLAFLIKALTTIQGVGEQVAPEFDLAGHVRPMIENLVRKQYTVSGLRERTLRSLAEYLELAEELPSEIRILATELRRKKFQLRLQMDELDRFRVAVTATGRLLSVALVLASLIVAASNIAQGGGALTTPLSIIALIGGIVFCALVVLWREN